MFIKTKEKFFKDMETSITDMIDSDLEFESSIILAFSEEKTFNSVYGHPVDIIKLFSAWFASGNPLHILLAKLGIELGMKLRKSKSKDFSKKDLDNMLGDMFKK